MIYLDVNATAPLKPAVREAMMAALGDVGNPSSVHGAGRAARALVERARAQVAAMVGVAASQVIFTSGGTEANNLALTQRPLAQCLISSIEHESVRAVHPCVAQLRVTADGVVDLAAAEESIAALPPASLVSVMSVNNETGHIQPVAELVRMAKKHGHVFHTDAVQAAGRLPLDFGALGVKMMSLSAHKIGGPQGIGALIVAPDFKIAPFMRGGGQERNQRAGTENVAAIVGFGVAATLVPENLEAMPRVTALRDKLQAGLIQLGGAAVAVPGIKGPRVGNTLCLALRGVSSATQVMALDLEGIAVSAGSACSSGKVKISHVMQAMGADEETAASAVRYALGPATQEAEIDACLAAWDKMARRFHSTT